MKFLFVGDYSNFHVSLATELKRLGHEATIVSSGSRCMDTQRDINLVREPGFVGGMKYMYRLFSVMSKMRGYDVVQLINPNFFELRPGKIRYFFNELRRHNRSVFLSLAGSDPYYVRMCCRSEELRYSEYRLGKEPAPFAQQNPTNELEWQTVEMLNHCEDIYNGVDGAVSCLYEYDVAGRYYLKDKLSYIGIPIDLESVGYMPAPLGEKINIFVGIKSEYKAFKGTDRLLAAAQRIEAEMPDRCRVEVVENLPYKEYMRRLESADIVLDQLYSYTPAPNALGAMAMGKVVVSGAEPEFYDFIGEHELRPVVNVTPDDEAIYQTIKELVLDRERLKMLSAQGREFVEKHNSSKVVVQRYLKHIDQTLK